jgi:HEAT repeat protein
MPIFGPNISALKQRRDVTGLLELLWSKNVRTRQEAIRALGEIGDSAAIPKLTVILIDEPRRISEHIEAARAIGKFADPSAIDALLQANAASVERENSSIERATAPKAKPHRSGYYVNQISAEEYTLRSTIAQSLGENGSARAVQALFEMLVMEKGWMASTACDAIRQVIAQAVERDRDAHTRNLIERLGHESKDVRQWAAYCLRYCHAQAAASPLLDIAWNEKEEFPVREAALGTLGKIADKSALDDLDDLARNPNRSIARLAAHGAIEIRQRRQLSNEQT